MKTVQDIDTHNKTVLVRTDYNVPLKDKKITSDLRIRASLPTINYLLEQGAKQIILLSHLGRPEGKPNADLSLSPVVDVLRELLPNVKIGFYPLPGKNIPKDVKIALLENLRFDPREEANSSDFIKEIIDATHADVFVQDGFAVVHRAHASTDAIKNFLPIYAGFLVTKEVENLSKAIEHPDRPFLLILGGAKVDDKQPLIDKFADSADNIVVGGKIAADGYKATNKNIYVAEDFDEDSAGNKLDTGPLSTGHIANLITDASTIIWNGLLGKAEDPAYATASTIVAELMGEKQNATTIICGGDTAGFAENLIEEHPSLSYSLLSTGGGAALEFLIGKKLPGLESITK